MAVEVSAVLVLFVITLSTLLFVECLLFVLFNFRLIQSIPATNAKYRKLAEDHGLTAYDITLVPWSTEVQSSEPNPEKIIYFYNNDRFLITQARFITSTGTAYQIFSPDDREGMKIGNNLMQILHSKKQTGK
ncbi:hypothetical protein J4232_04495 [Candidatus Woesearchaeota archaeon]|nr:hypothetical protein [Candidatus Woesearchaeota archaeon]